MAGWFAGRLIRFVAFGCDCQVGLLDVFKGLWRSHVIPRWFAEPCLKVLIVFEQNFETVAFVDLLIAICIYFVELSTDS